MEGGRAQRGNWLAATIGVAILLLACTSNAEPSAEPTPTAESSATADLTTTGTTARVSPALASWARSYCGVLNDVTAQPDPYDLPRSPSANFDDQMAWVTEQIPLYIEAIEAALRHLNSVDVPEPAAEFHQATADLIEALVVDLTAALPEIDAAHGVADFVSARDDTPAIERAGPRLDDSRQALAPEVTAALEAEPFCNSSDSANPDDASIRSGNIDPELDERLLITVADLASGNWRFAEFDDADYQQTGRTDPACAADLPNLSVLGGPLSATSITDPSNWGVRFLFNGAMGVDGSQLWSEVWAFDTSEAAITSFENTQKVLDGERGPLCLDTSDSVEEGTDGYSVVSDPEFQLPESIAYALDDHVGEGNNAVDSHIEVHIIQRGRFVGMLIFYDHSPSDLWQQDGTRVLELFEAHLTATAAE